MLFSLSQPTKKPTDLFLFLVLLQRSKRVFSETASGKIFKQRVSMQCLFAWSLLLRINSIEPQQVWAPYVIVIIMTFYNKGSYLGFISIYDQAGLYQKIIQKPCKKVTKWSYINLGTFCRDFSPHLSIQSFHKRCRKCYSVSMSNFFRLNRDKSLFYYKEQGKLKKKKKKERMSMPNLIFRHAALWQKCAETSQLLQAILVKPRVIQMLRHKVMFGGS